MNNQNKQFDKKYELHPEYQDNPGNLKKRKFIQDEQIRIQSDIPIRPSNISYFEKIMYSENFKKSRPRVGYFCNIIPSEIIMAFDAQPVRLDCGNNAAAISGEELFSSDVCPLAKASFGNFLYSKSIANTCDILILPTSCDAKRKLGETLNDFKPTFMLNLPCEQSHELYAKKTYNEILRLVKFLENHLNKKISKKLLQESVKLTNKRTVLTRKLQQLKIEKPQSISIRDSFLIIQSSQFRPILLQDWIKETEKVIQELENFKIKHKSLKPKLILTGAPIVWPNFKILNILEESGAEIIADTICSGLQSSFDPVILDEYGKTAILRALTNRYIYAAICPCFISQTTRINRILDLVEETNADGVINYSLRLCQLFDMENYRIEKILKKNKISYINIRTDYSLEDTEQLRVRIEAFLETLY
ncbi:2-hydroxyacyl-CoA dehydratase subunit D [bacterium]